MRQERTSSLKEIKPVFTLDQIYGTDLIYNPRPSIEDHGHFADDPVVNETLTGRELSILGEMPVVCRDAVCTTPALNILEKTGLKIPPIRYTYRNTEEYLQLLQLFREKDQRVVMQYPHPKKEVPEDLYWVKPDVIEYVNDKNKIDELVPSDYVPERKTISYKQMKEEIDNKELTAPVVLKTGDGEPTAGGFGVKICTTEEDMLEAIEFFKQTPEIIVEQHIDYHSNICVQYACNTKGEITYLGNTEQIVSEGGNHKGSWVNVTADMMDAATEAGKEIMKNAYEKGYVGIAGFDVVFTDTHFYFIDLNFRMNASTGALLLSESIYHTFGKDEIRLNSWTSNLEFDDMLELLEKYIEKEWIIPLSIFDPRYVPFETDGARVTGLIIADSKDEINSMLEEMAQDGLVTS